MNSEQGPRFAECGPAEVQPQLGFFPDRQPPKQRDSRRVLPRIPTPGFNIYLLISN